MTVCHTDGQHVARQEFDNDKDRPRWPEEVMQIKHTIENINVEHDVDDRPPLCGSWLKMVDQFRDRWCPVGEDGKAPLDVKCVVWSAQDGLGVERTQWHNNDGWFSLLMLALVAEAAVVSS